MPRLLEVVPILFHDAVESPELVAGEAAGGC
jgi:hypothetical protein